VEKANKAAPKKNTVKITVHGATDIKDADAFTKSDPYCVVQAGGKSKHTKVQEDNLSPVWNETFAFELPAGPQKASCAPCIFETGPFETGR
jgi:Ca2+-dependent lipid-binding protein